MALASPADEAPSLRTLPAELLLEVAVRSPLRLLRLVLRVDVSTAAAMRLQRWFRAWRHALPAPAPSPLPPPFPVGARVLLRRTAPLARQFATVAAAPEPPSLACRLQLLDGRFVDVSASRLRRLDGWADARWADGVARASARASASAARSAATSAAVAAACALHSGVASDHSALAVAAATAASTAAAAATAASTAAAPAAGTGADEQEATALLLATRQVHEALHGAPAARGAEAAAGEVASLLVKAAASAASDAAAAAGAAAHAAIAADGVGSLPVTASTVAAVASAAGQVASAVEAMRQTSPRGADAAGKSRLAARTAAEVYADVGSAARALSTAWTGGSEPHSYTFETAKQAAMLLQHSSLPTGAPRAADAAPPPPPPQYVPLPDRDAVVDFLRRANPALYGPPAGKSARPTAAQTAALDDAALGLCLMMKAAAARSPTGALPADDCPLLYAPTDPRNVWALEGRLHADARMVELPFAAVKVKVQQRWTQSKDAAAPPKPERIEGHSTAAVCWDGSVVLADFLCLPPAVLLSHSPALARRPSAYAEWRWAQKTVVELGCGISALPSLVAARNGAKCVVSTDGNAEVLRMTRANAAQWLLEHPAATKPLIHPLLWGDRADVVRQLGGVGVEAPVDVILAADCLYVLENPGAWGKLLSTIVALSTPDTLTFVTYTDRGHDKMWRRFLEQRVQKLFHVVLVADHLLHPNARPGSHGRLEQSKPVQVYCLSLLDTPKLADSAIPVPASC